MTTRRGRVAAAVAMTVAAGFVFVARGQDKPAASLVKPQTFISLDAVPQGKTFEAAVVVAIEKGYHMNSNKPSETYLIATTLTPMAPAGIKVLDTMYPPGKDTKFPFTEKPLNVYSGTVTLKLKLATDATTPVGDVTIPTVLRYQACSESACLPPVKVPVDVPVKVVKAGTPAHRAHPEVFGARK
jgi:cytochrome c biogenesis DsbD-like protein